MSCQRLNSYVAEIPKFTMLIITILGLMGAADEQSGDASLFANALRRAVLVSAERCFGLEAVRAKDEAKVLTTNRLDMQ